MRVTKRTGMQICTHTHTHTHTHIKYKCKDVYFFSMYLYLFLKLYVHADVWLSFHMIYKGMLAWIIFYPRVQKDFRLVSRDDLTTGTTVVPVNQIYQSKNTGQDCDKLKRCNRVLVLGSMNKGRFIPLEISVGQKRLQMDRFETTSDWSDSRLFQICPFVTVFGPIRLAGQI